MQNCISAATLRRTQLVTKKILKHIGLLIFIKHLPPGEVLSEHNFGKYNRAEARLATRRADVYSDLPIDWLFNHDQVTYLSEL